MRRLVLAAAVLILVGCTPTLECDQVCADAVNGAIADAGPYDWAADADGAA